MIDINLFRKENRRNLSIIKNSIKKRFENETIIDLIIEADENWRKSQFEMEQLISTQKYLSLLISSKKKNKEDFQDQIQEINLLIPKKIEAEKKAKELKEKLDNLLRKVGNIVDEDVPFGKYSDSNKIIKIWGEIPKIQENQKNFSQLLLQIDNGFNQEKANIISGKSGYFLKGFPFLLSQALINFSLQFLMKKGYSLIQTPCFIKKKLIEKISGNEDYENSLYHISGNFQDDLQEKFLINSPEQPLIVYHQKEKLIPENLPLKYAGFSTCFPKKEKEILQVEQFEQIEQFLIVSPYSNLSEKFQQEIISNLEEFYQLLKIPYQVVLVCSGQLDQASSKRYDLECWFPSFGQYKKLGYCSNYKDFYSRKLSIKFGKSKRKKKQYVHMLNGTLVAIQNCVCCIIENYATEKGIVVPEVLRSFIGEVSFIPFLK
ncbi:seryl-tRNA synthetase [Anaeramoeba ignava]|uniref:serine--tRNA ligase n=1 Tax=Anaeramoeba ignava TaxID=1746090 RepID=A0A9Q0RI73_ANAIG|nr:seryl-tRNA synthetase [Anaeramoeba ignava]